MQARGSSRRRSEPLEPVWHPPAHWGSSDRPAGSDFNSGHPRERPGLRKMPRRRIILVIEILFCVRGQAPGPRRPGSFLVCPNTSHCTASWCPHCPGCEFAGPVLCITDRNCHRRSQSGPRHTTAMSVESSAVRLTPRGCPCESHVNSR